MLKAQASIVIFLLSSKAGGVGINLIGMFDYFCYGAGSKVVGGSRLVLIDSDWNPRLSSRFLSSLMTDYIVQ